MEPITIFSRIAAPDKVVKRLRELCPDIEVEGPDGNWSRAVISVLIDGKVSTLTFSHNAEYYSEPNWSRQMDGMRGYFARFPATENRNKVMGLTTTFCFSLGTVCEPDFDPSGDVRLSIIFEIAELLDGVLFTATTLRDANGRILLSLDEEDHDPEAVWPKVLAQISVDDFEKDHDDEEDAEPPTAERVARRAVALCALTVRAMLEQDVKDPHALEMYQDMLRWLENSNIDDELEPDEWKVIQRPLGKLDPRSQVNSTWRLEGLCVLAWALGKFEIPPPDQMVRVQYLWRALGLFDDGATRQLLDNPTLRSPEELNEMRKMHLALHWRLRNFKLVPEVMDFEEFADKCWFGPLSIEGFKLVDGDLCLFEKRIDELTEDELSLASSIAVERHMAINWLCFGPELYSEADTST